MADPVNEMTPASNTPPTAHGLNAVQLTADRTNVRLVQCLCGAIRSNDPSQKWSVKDNGDGTATISPSINFGRFAYPEPDGEVLAEGHFRTGDPVIAPIGDVDLRLYRR